MNRAGVRLTVLAGALLGAASVANAAMIEEQQSGLGKLKPVWEAKTIPAGLQKDALRPVTPRDSGARALSLHVRNVDFYFVDEIGFHVDDLAVGLEAANPADPVDFDDPRSFIIRIHNGKVVVPPKSLTALFNKHLLQYSPRPLNDMTVDVKDGKLLASGGLKMWSFFPGIWLPASLSGPITLNDQNKLVYTPEGVGVLGIPLGGLLRGLGIELSWLLTIKREGAELVKSALVLDHRTVFPPPRIEGNVATAAIVDGGLELTFADNQQAVFAAPPEKSDSYLWMQSGDAKLFDAVVTNSRIMVVNKEKNETLHFDLYDYRRQVVAGTLHMTEDGTMIARLPTYPKVKAEGKTAEASQ
jgi:hypothetical protein